MGAKELFYSGYNCTQAVAVAFSEKIGLSEERIAKLVSGFGGGFSRLREVCGAISGMVFVLDALYGYSSPDDHEGKATHYARIREAVAKFKEKVGAIRCQEILKNPEIGGNPEIRTPEYYKKRRCPELVDLAEKILIEYISEHPIEN